MLLRKYAEGVIAVSQPAHAWLSGQLARNWRVTDFVGVKEEVCIAAEQHDIGFMEWEQSPTLNPSTGLPHTFMEMPRAIHLEVWTRGIQQMLWFGRYPALLVSRHFTGLAQRNGFSGTAQDERLLLEFLERQEEFQSSLETSLANDFHYGEFSTEEILRHHQQLVSLWDWVSLLLCHRLKKPQVVAWPVWKKGATELQLTPLEEAGAKVKVEPWPFAVQAVDLVCEGRHLLRSYTDESEMREGLRAAAPVVLGIRLEPA
jgi:hypothetical protein